MNVNLKDYLTDEEIKNIVKEEFRNTVRTLTKKDVERIIENSSYHIVWKAVEEVYDGDVNKVLKDKVIDILKDLDSFHVFRTPNAWDRVANTPYQTLCDVVKSNASMLDEVVKNKINTLSKSEINKITTEVMKERMSKVLGE